MLKNASLFKKKSIRPKPKYRGEVIVVGDIHGELDGLLEILLYAGLMDSNACWSGHGRVLVQLGDVVDRGPSGLESYDLLAKLQREAILSGGRVVRLLGNHEFEILKGNFYLTNILPAKVAQFRQRLIEDIFAGRIKAAYAAKGYLFTHAGLTGPIQDAVSKETGGKADVQEFASIINKLLVKAVETGNYSHPIFNIGRSRGGRNKYGGIFWGDMRELFECDSSYHIKQVIGHTPVQKITFSHNRRLIAVDVGIFRDYGGRRTYLKLGKSKPQIADALSLKP